jgi:pimeloyl-ACP methyl ester carboxylesterase
MLDPIEFCEIVRKGEGGVPVACVGDARPIPFLLAQIPPNVPVLHLKLDGVDVWPPQYFTAAKQAEVYVHSLERYCPDRQVAVMGWSYGGFLAYELGQALIQRRWTRVSLLMIEPLTPWRLLSFSRYRLLRRKAGKALRRVRAFFDPHRSPRGRRNSQPQVDSNESGPSRWNLMTAFYDKNVDRIRPQPFQGPLTLVGTEFYHARFGQAWRRIAKGHFEECIFAKTDSHAAFTQPTYAEQWLNCLNHWYTMTDNLNGART